MAKLITLDDLDFTADLLAKKVKDIADNCEDNVNNLIESQHWVILSQAEYDELVENNKIKDDYLYFIK